MRISVIGSINMDFTLETNELPKKGETLISKYYCSSPGGKGANQAVAASRIGAEVSMIGCVGNDEIGSRLKDSLKNEGINVDNVITVEDSTGNAYINIDSNGDNTIIVYPGANAKLDCEMIKKCEDTIKNSDMIMTQLEIPVESIIEAMKIAKGNNVKVLFNPAPVKDLPEEIFKLVDIITPNETELLKLTGESSIKEGAQRLLDKGVGSVIVTLGEQGSYYLGHDGEFFGKPFRVDAKDTTAAGDSFNAAVAIKLISEESIEKGLEFGNAAGALAATKLGAQASIPFREDIEKFLKENMN